MDARRDDNELVQQYLASRDPALREEIIMRYLPLVHFVLGRLGLSQTAGQDYEDAVSQGIIGLIEAVDRYDLAYGTQFSTYATLRIRGKVIDQLRAHDWLSRGARQRARKIQNAIDTLWEKFQRQPTDEELADFLNLDENSYRQALLDSSHTLVSLDTAVVNDGNEVISLHELLADEVQQDPDEQIEDEELKNILIQAIKSLPEREQIVLSLYYYERLTFKEIGAVLDVSESRACQLHTKAVMSLRARIVRLLYQHSDETSSPAKSMKAVKPHPSTFPNLTGGIPQ